MKRIVLLKIYLLSLILLWGIVFPQELDTSQNLNIQPGVSSTDPSRFQPNIFPPSPEAFKLGSYGNIPIGMFTGAPNIDIPIMHYSTGKADISILLNYSSNGIKVDEFSGIAGLGWKFISGGVITRVIRALPDEKGQNPGHLVNPPDLDSLSTEDGNVRQFLLNATTGGLDSEPDIYYANFCGNSLSFVFDKRGKPRIISQKNVIIEGTSGGSSFTIILENGIKYYFNNKETTMNRVAGGGHTIQSTNISAWYLSKITDTNNVEMYFEYNDDNITGVRAENQTMTLTLPGSSFSVMGVNGNCINGTIIPPTIHSPISHMQTINGLQLSRIYSNNPTLGEIQFTYQKFFGDDAGQISTIKKMINTTTIESYSFYYIKTINNDRAFLEKIIDNKTGKKYLFDYVNPSSTPARLSYSRDMWGYYNGKTNYTLIPLLDNVPLLQNVMYNGANQEVNGLISQTGLLKKITYPTGGYTMINYEPNTIKGIKTYKGITTAKQLQVSRASIPSAPNTKPTDEVSFYNEKDQYMMVSLYGDFNSDDCSSGQDTGFHHQTSIGGSFENGQPLVIPPAFGSGQFCPGWPTPPVGSVQYGPIIRGNSVTCFYTPKGQVTFRLNAVYKCTIGASNINYKLQDEEKTENILVGGSRVANTISYDGPSGTPITISYKYDDPTDNFSTGILVRKPYFIDRSTSGALCIVSSTELPLIHLSSDNFGSLNATHPNFFYKTVREFKNGGYIAHQFSTSIDYNGNIIQGSDIISSPWTNFGWSNGRELITTYFDSNNNIQKMIENDYVEDKQRQSTIIGLSLRKEYELTYEVAPIRKCSVYDLELKYSEYECTTNHQHVWYNQQCINTGANNILRVTYDECYGKTVGTEFTHTGVVNNISIVQYQNISRFDYLKSQKTTDYLGGVPIKTETEYFYNNPVHFQLTKQSLIMPDNSTQITEYAYAREKGNQLMIDKNMIGIPLETTTTQTIGTASKTLAKIETVYPKITTEITNNNAGLVLPLSVKSYDILNLASTPSTEVIYDKYDSNGNLQQYTTKDGTPVTIIWGYNNTQPIAKVEGATYSQVSPYSSAIISASENDNNPPPGMTLDQTEEALIGALNSFRNNTNLSAYQTTTYTYDPLIGVRSITPPSGIREVYIYDSANRLKEIRENDAAGKLLKEFKYNYKN